MDRGKIIVVEGISNSGKTTTCQNLKKYKNCVIIDECMIYEKQPPRPSNNYEDEIKNQLFFFDVERRRMRKATYLSNQGKNVILDRCAISTVAVSYAMEKMGKYKTFKHALSEYEKVFNSEEFIKPDEYYFLFTDRENTLKRNNSRSKKLKDSWLEEKFNYYQNEFYKSISKKIPNSKMISTTNKEKDYVSNIVAQDFNFKKIENINDIEFSN